MRVKEERIPRASRVLRNYMVTCILGVAHRRLSKGTPCIKVTTGRVLQVCCRRSVRRQDQAREHCE